ncbi:MAG: phosphatase PAP2 family protein [Methylotenera sp.]
MSNLFFDAQQHRFILRGNPFLSIWMHTGLKWLMVGTAFTSLFLSIVASKFPPIKHLQLSFLWVFVGMAVSTSAVTILKHYSMHGCPWDLTLYGGELPLFGLFENPPVGAEAGGCFPAGHPSGGFALMAFYFAFRQHQQRLAILMLWLGIVMGLVMGLVQVMRGAHFLSHVLWSGWVVWLTLLLLYWIWMPKLKEVAQHHNDV